MPEIVQKASESIPSPPIPSESIYRYLRSVTLLDSDPPIRHEVRHDGRSHDERGWHHKYAYVLRFQNCLIELTLQLWHQPIGMRRLTTTIGYLRVTYGPENSPHSFRVYNTEEALDRINRLFSPS